MFQERFLLGRRKVIVLTFKSFVIIFLKERKN